MTIAQESAARGAQLLDKIEPGWFNHINVGNLDISSGSFCILGQLYGTYEQGIDHHLPGEISAYNSANWGFCLGRNESYADLDMAWLSEIMARRNPPGVEIIKQTLAEEAKEHELVPA